MPVFGPRHIHTLPYRLMPAFDSANEDHQRIAELARQLAAIATAAVAGDEYLADLSDDAKVRSRTRPPPGHPEGYLEAFANLYAGFAEVINARLDGRQPGKLGQNIPARV